VGSEREATWEGLADLTWAARRGGGWCSMALAPHTHANPACTPSTPRTPSFFLFSLTSQYPHTPPTAQPTANCWTPPHHSCVCTQHTCASFQHTSVSIQRLGAPAQEAGPSRKSEQLLRRNVKRFRGGLVFKAHRRVYHSTLRWRVIQKKREERARHIPLKRYWPHKPPAAAATSIR